MKYRSALPAPFGAGRLVLNRKETQLKLFAEPLGSRHRLTWLVGAIALVSCALLGVAARAHASETIYWDNYNFGNVAFANIDGTGGAKLDVSETEIESPEGMAFDPATGLIYIASSQNDEIDWVSIHGGSGILKTGAAPVADPRGIAVDLANQMVYWGNSSGVEAIGYASAQNTGVGGALNATGSESEGVSRIALDPVAGRVYWLTQTGPTDGGISYANLDGSGGGFMPVAPAEMAEGLTGVVVDPAAQRLYVQGEQGSEERLFWLSLVGLGGGVVDRTNAAMEEPYGLAFDPSIGRFYWGNYDSELGVPAAIGTATLAPGGGGGINITAPVVEGPQDPIVLKSPTAITAPQVTASGTALNCSTGAWSQDYVGSYVYGAPESYGYQWSKDGQSIAGATGTTLNATASGSYACSVTATNQFGSAAQTSAGYTVTIAPPVTPASFALASASRKKVKVAAGKAAVLSLTLKNAGGTASSSSKVCVKLTKKAKKAKKGLIAPKCAAVAALAPGASKKVTLKVKTKSGAKGTYKFSVVVSGASGSKSLAEQITVTAKKKHHKK
jgi:DNA-binding beta-propeller fold protein YncE